MLYTIEKLDKRIAELSEYRYRDAIAIRSLQCASDEEGNIGERPPTAFEQEALQLGDSWEGNDTYLWLRTEIKAPEAWQGRKIVGRFDFGTSGPNHISGFESLLYVNGVPYQGVDTNHQEVLLPQACAMQTHTLAFRLWSGLKGYGSWGPRNKAEHKMLKAELTWLDETADDVYFTAKAALETIKRLPENSADKQMLLAAVNKAFLQISWAEPGSPAFYESVAAASDVLRSELDSLDKNSAITVHCVGHTHIDVAWLWQLKHTREKCARSFSTVLRLMEQYPEYLFLQTQPQLYEYMKEDYPEIYEQIRTRVQEGRWEADGAMWLEPDCNLTSGESLVRQILYGTRFLREEFGVECSYLWLPDVFGYSWALPQILQKSGIHTFMTTKISWNQYNRMPHDTFMWRGIDGTEILTHFITTPEPNNTIYTYNGMVTPETVQGIWDNYKDKALNKDLLLCYGYGDGGGGVTREMLEMRRRLDELPGLPNVKTSRADDYFAGLQERVAASDEYVHTWDGELYLEYHRGTYTSQARNKLLNRKAELLLRESEFTFVLEGLLKEDWSTYPTDELLKIWKTVLRNQFHDILPGTSIREVYTDSWKEYEEADYSLVHLWKQALAELTRVERSAARSTYTIYNSASWERGETVYIPEANSNGIWLAANGSELQAQRSGDGWIVQTNSVPAMGISEIHFQAGESQSELAHGFGFQANSLTTPFYELEWNDYGQLTRIYDKENDREVLKAGEYGNVLQVFENKPLRDDAWGIDIYYGEKKREVKELVSVELKEVGPVRAVVCFAWTFGQSQIEQELIVYTHSRRMDFQTNANWHEREQMLKVAFPVSIRSTEASYDIQYGNVKRPTHWNTSWDYARFETVGQQWADLSEHGYGVSLLNDCKYGYDIKNHVMRLSLINSPVFPDPEADRGEHEFTYALLPHAGDWREGETVREAWSLNSPQTVTVGGTSHAGLSLFTLSSPHAFIDAVKKAEDENAVILRIHEFAGARGQLEITSSLPIRGWAECDLMERIESDKQDSSIISCTMNPYEIKTFVVYF
ncbi:alpha-mannosidase [Paenibacillus qinlingensis]|uniref:Alpha-mannosidase n=1 Tax=Paenibacillus qinlingensis TaxID=1837343 RepID=A0ABU1NU89_9BACL|nr:alpha-mannosidase [Paenibacillus qinlingensis]MDR6551052.1 alpha-mannosidase [Paenibacillus qinlingensis]